MKPARQAKAILRRASMFWTPLVVGSAFLIAAPALLFTKPEAADLIAAGHVSTCAPIGPVASRYVDREACRRARKEVLRSLKIGRDPDWGDVVRDSIPPASKRFGRHSKSKHPGHEGRKQPVTETPTPRPTSEATKSPPTTEQPSEQAEPSTPPRTPTRTEEDVPTPTEPAKLNGHMSELANWAGIAIVFAIAIAIAIAIADAAVYVAERRRAVIQPMHAVLRRINHKVRRTTRPSPMTPSRTWYTTGAGSHSPPTSFPSPAQARKTPSAAWSWTPSPTDAAEVVMARPDAWRLFGVEIGSPREKCMPDLGFTDEAVQTCTFLAWPSSRLFLVTCTEEGRRLLDFLFHDQGKNAIDGLISD